MADDAVVDVTLPTLGGDEGVWDDKINAALDALNTGFTARVNALRQYVLDHPGGSGATDADVAALILDTDSVTYDAVVALILSQGVDPTVTVASISDITLAAIETFLTAGTTAAARTAIGAQDVTWTPAIADVAGLVGQLAGKAPVSHTHSALPGGSITGLATVATSGSYNDLANKPAIPGADITNAAAGQVFFRSYIGGEWESRGSNRTDVMILWDPRGTGVALPADAVANVDKLLAS